MVASIEVACYSTIDLSAVRGELRALNKCHKKFNQGHHDPVESLHRSNNLAITRDKLWREMKAELTVVQVEITHLRGQLS